MEYTGEHTYIGEIGNVFVILSFVFALLASISYFFAARDNEQALSWKRIARWSFRIHGISVFGIVATLFVMLYNHYFEYEYVWHHSSKTMQMRYILSCFWEGQEGSFLLWTFWHVVIGFILQRKAKEWEAPVLSVIALVQTFLTSMLLGLYIGSDHPIKIGSNPFTVLLRNHPDFYNIPLFTNPNYLQNLDGHGLNPLLQNYWMTIHPPTLFLGFALTVVPFAFAIAGLWKKKYTEWLKPALPWTFLGIAVLGVGILMGGAWAYEALSFGGFWAWDPVENASLVPWLTLVGAGHLMLINKNKGQSLFTAFGLAILTFILILYSTFLTRSGILGETSVHAFTDLGMSGQLLIYLFAFLFLGIFLLLIDKKIKIQYAIASTLFIILIYILGSSSFHLKMFTVDADIPFRIVALFCWIIYTGYAFVKSSTKFLPQSESGKEESIYSREFWMFVGAIILLVSSFQIMFNTSLPVWNKLFGLHKAPPTDVKQFYNAWQLPFAFLTTFLIAIGQYFKYKDTNIKEFFKKIGLSLLIAAIATALISYGLHYSNPLYILLLFSALFAAFANAAYMIQVFGGKIKKAGASIAHVGFALVLLGALISTSKKDVISQNTSGKSVESIGKDYSDRDNILLTQGDTLPMGKYYVAYTGNHTEGFNTYFDVDYFLKNAAGKYDKQFRLSPLIQQNPNPQFGNAAEPDTRHFLTFDVYTHITFYDHLPDLKATGKKEESKDEYAAAKNVTMAKGDTIFSSNAIIIFDSLSTQFDKTSYHLEKDDIAVMAHISVLDVNKKYQATPVYIIHNNSVQPIASKVDNLGLQFMFWKINPEDGKVDFSVQEKKSNIRDYIVMKAMIFPYINILWMGCIIMAIGTFLAIWARIRRAA
ncbi:MAG: cytochrome c biosis factor [Bacteroidetes bacterium]|nr:cytochrome c biosis factor [Bacteroidota bacterium]